MQIVPGTSVDGPGLRTSVYFAGCTHHCPECHNPQTWDFQAGKSMTFDEIMDEIKYNDFNVTFTGGDPLCSPIQAIELARLVKNCGYNLWIYTGFSYEEILHNPLLRPILNYADVIVDGRFDSALRDISLLFRGSSNQRIIDVAKSSASNKIILWSRES